MTGGARPALSTSYTYNGMSDHLQQTVDSVTTNHTLDLAVGLTQVLEDGSNTYMYGLGRIGEQQVGGFVLHLGDALGSVRQLRDTTGEIVLAKDYEPYGEVMDVKGEGGTNYSFTNEYTSQGLIYLRARWYAPAQGRFLTKDGWQGNYYRPLSQNGWNYVEGNP